MAEVKSLQNIQEKYGRVTPGRSEDYKIGVTTPRRSWAKAAAAANDAYKAGVIDAANKNRFKAGVDAAGDSKWQGKALSKGPGRFSEGTMLAAPDYAKGFAKYHDVLTRVQLKPRFPKGDPRNLENVSIVTQALRKAKVGA